jgi:hypothetical protein
MEQMGTVIVDILERAGARYLKHSEPDLYRAYLLNIGGADTVRRYDSTETYWDRVQLILDGFFSARERALICGEVIAHAELWAQPEFRGFLARAIAEHRLQSLLAAGLVAPPSRPEAGSAVIRRAR